MNTVETMLAFLVLLLVAQVQAGQAQRENSSDGGEALVVEYIPEYRVKINDVKSVIDNQFSKFSIGTVKTAYATIDKASFLFTYKNGSVPTYLTPVKVQIANDSYSIAVNFTVTVLHTVGKKQYNCQHSLPSPVIVNYTKEINLQSGSTVISNYNTSFGPSDFAGDAVCTEKPTDKDKTRIHQIVSGTQSSSIYLEVKKGIANVRKWMQDNVQSEHLSQIYPDNPYNYKFYDYQVAVDVSTIGTSKFGDSGVVNKIKGSIPTSSHFVQSLPTYEQGFNLFFTKEFMMNLIEDSIKNNQKWKGITANRTNMRSRSFRFRLVDYQYIVPAVLKKYPKLYLQDTQISCSAKGYQNMKIYPGQNISVEFLWSCIGSVTVAPNTQYNFINFQPNLLYEVTVDVRSKDYLTVYEKVKKVVSLNFNIVDDNPIEDFQMVKFVIEEVLFEFQGYPIGGFFKVKTGSSQVLLAEEGLWVG